MCRALLKPDQDLVFTKYFTARVTNSPTRVKRQGTFIEALQTLPEIKVYFGQYDGEDFRCDYCGQLHTWHNEKMTDVNIAAEMMKDAVANRFDTAMLVTGDSDQTPTIRMIKEVFPTKRVVVGFPPRRVSKWLKQVSDGAVHIHESILSASLLPDIVHKPDGYALQRPERWK
jgi:uncharacterized LabA/DUF88 family protein